MPSQKTRVIEYLFEQRWSETTKKLTNPVVTMVDVVKAIEAVNAANGTKLSAKNPANFFKDIVRNTRAANANWPSSVFAGGYTGRQTTREGQSFEFVPIRPGSAVAFETVPSPGAATQQHRIETASLPIASRRLGRRDEPWLTQVLVRVRLIETHFSLFSSKRVAQVDHLQMTVKLRQAEIDALYLAIEDPAKGGSEFLISVEAKGKRDDILETQLMAQVGAIFASKGIAHERVVPVAVKIVGESRIHVVEYEEVTKAAYPALNGLALAHDVLYQLVPSVPGIR